MNRERVIFKVMAKLDKESANYRMKEILEKVIFDGTSEFRDSFNRYVQKAIIDPKVKETIEMLEEGLKQKEIAEALKVSISTISKIYKDIISVLKEFATTLADEDIRNFINKSVAKV